MSIIKVTQLVNNIDAYVRENTADLSERYRLVSAVIGAAIATQLSIPSTKVTNSRIYYHDTHYLAVTKYINDINEAYPIDVEVALHQAFDIWNSRYRFVHPGYVNVSDVIARISDMSTHPVTDHDVKDAISIVSLFRTEDAPVLNNIINDLVTQLKDNNEDA